MHTITSPALYTVAYYMFSLQTNLTLTNTCILVVALHCCVSVQVPMAVIHTTRDIHLALIKWGNWFQCSIYIYITIFI